MVQKIKLICPICEKQFITNRSQKLYCSDRCRENNGRIRHQLDENKCRQDTLKNDIYIYIFEEDKFYLRSIYSKKTHHSNHPGIPDI